MYGTLIIILLILLSGLIAYLGDQIGMKVGKKRLSLFGLRPRYTSIIITVATGILIAVLSITILLTVYSSLREALLNINDVVQRLERLNEQVELKDEELNSMKDEIDQKTDELDQLQSQRNQLQDKLTMTQREFDEAIKSLENARADVSRLRENRDELKERVSELRDQREKLEARVEELDENIAELNEDYEEAQEMAEKYRAGMYYYMGEDIVYQKGDVIYSEVIEGGRSEDETIEGLNRFLSEANEVAKERPIKVDEDTGMALELQTEDILYTARVLYNMEPGQQVIVSLVAGINVPRDEWLKANFILNKNFVVFEEDEIIAKKVIEADQAADKIDSELRDLLSEINQTASKRGLLTDSQGRVGSLDFINFYQVLQQIQSREGKVEIKVISTRKMWRNDRLSDNLEFEIEEDVKEDSGGSEDDD